MDESLSGKVTPENGGEIKEENNLEQLEMENDKVCSEENPRIEVVPATPTHSVTEAEQKQLSDDGKMKQQVLEHQHNTEMLQLLDTINQLRAELEQKESIIKLNERERTILEKEKISVSHLYILYLF